MNNHLKNLQEKVNEECRTCNTNRVVFDKGFVIFDQVIQFHLQFWNVRNMCQSVENTHKNYVCV